MLPKLRVWQRVKQVGRNRQEVGQLRRRIRHRRRMVRVLRQHLAVVEIAEALQEARATVGLRVWRQVTR
jgi:hypothetical protein